MFYGVCAGYTAINQVEILVGEREVESKENCRKKKKTAFLTDLCSLEFN